MSNQAFTFAAAFSIAIVLTPLARKLALRWGFVDNPGPRKIHVEPVPLLGGLAIYAAVVLMLLLAFDQHTSERILAVTAASTLLVLVGLVDDYRTVHPHLKLWFALPLAGMILAVGGLRVTAFPISPLLVDSADLTLLLSYLLTIGWVVVITCAFTILDHMDGLCAGVAAVASAFFMFFAILEGQVLVGVLSAAMLGANLGFLKWNFKRASIFMGESGALFVGLMMSTLAIMLKFSNLTTYTSWMIPIVILAVPLFDLALVVASRLWRGLAPSRSPGTDHAAHRLASLGMGESAAVITMYTASVLAGGLAVLLTWLSVAQAYVVFGLVVLAGMLAIVRLEQAPYERQDAANGGGADTES